MAIEPNQAELQQLNLASNSYMSGQALLQERSETIRKRHGQYLTPPLGAAFMVEQLGMIHDGDRILDPSVGSGTLLCAVIESLINTGQTLEVWVEGYEIDAELYELATENIERAVQEAARYGITVRPRLHCADFVTQSIRPIQPSLFDSERSPNVLKYQKIIANPPYFKLSSHDARSKALKNYVAGNTNIYTVFMAFAASMLTTNGRACFLVPRSFCSGAYFAEFRRKFLSQVTPYAVHLFESRQANFNSDNILQENLIIAFDSKETTTSDADDDPTRVLISTSASTDDLPDRRRYHASLKSLIGKRNSNLFLRFPLNKLDEQLIEIMDSWQYQLHDFGWEVSTGRVVAFRSRDYLQATEQENSVPLFWLHNIQPLKIIWPVKNGEKIKSQWIAITGSESLLIPVSNYTILRRFSSKEEARRLVATYLLNDEWANEWIGLENHLNYVYGVQQSMTPAESIGLAIYYSSGLADRYFRLVNGSTQVNATELRSLPLPPLRIIQQMGRQYMAERQSHERIVLDTLKMADLVPRDFPLLLETRNL